MAHIIVSNFDDHQPLYRQARDLCSRGRPGPAQSASWSVHPASGLRPASYLPTSGRLQQDYRSAGRWSLSCRLQGPTTAAGLTHPDSVEVSSGTISGAPWPEKNIARPSFAFESKSPFVDPLQMIDVFNNLFRLLRLSGDQGAQMLIQMFACSPSEVGH